MKNIAIFSLGLILLVSVSPMQGEAPGWHAFASDGVSIACLVEGNGAPVVLIHGLHASAEINWKLPGTVKRLADRYQVIAPDVRGVRSPIAIFVGSRDPVKRLYVEPLARIRKDWPVTEIEGAGRLGCIFKDRFKEELVRWLDRNAGR